MVGPKDPKDWIPVKKNMIGVDRTLPRAQSDNYWGGFSFLFKWPAKRSSSKQGSDVQLLKGGEKEN